MSDRAAFESAIAANPADLTARLVYADFLDETGDPADAARAEFVRAQVEADALPPGDDRRRALAGRAAELFAGYWIDWWRPVCEAVGLPVPEVARAAGTRLRDRLARLFATPRPDGWPYRPYWTHLGTVNPLPWDGSLTGLERVGFIRGWPEELVLGGDLARWAAPLRRWVAASPLTRLALYGTMGRDWSAIAGDHLRGVTQLRLVHHDTNALRAVATSPHLPALTDLDLDNDRSHSRWTREQLRILTESPLAQRLERLTVHLARPDEAALLTRPDGFVRLTDLTLGLEEAANGDWAGALEVLSAAPFVPRLESFTLDTGSNIPGEAPLLPPEAVPALLRLLGALDPDRVRRIDLKGQQRFLPAVAELLAERFGDRMADRSVT